MAELTYREIAPHPALRPFISTYWRLEGDPPAPVLAPERVLPDGSIEAIVHLGDRFLHHEGAGRARRQPRAFIVGQLTGPFFVGPSGRADVVGVRFRPGGLAPFVNLPAGELTGSTVPLEDLLGTDAASLVDRLLTCRTHRETAGLLDAFLAARLTSRPAPRDGIHPAVDALSRRSMPSDPAATETVSATARRLGLSVRHLERIFRREVGLPPRLFARIRRFDAVIRRLGSTGPVSLADLAAGAGYTDQAHMTREFREFSGITPGAYRRERLPLSDLFTAVPR